MNDFIPNIEQRAKQRNAILAALRVAPVSTVYAREVLGIAHPAGRCLELRKAGHQITTERGTVYDAVGRPHRSAVYVLLQGAAP